MTGPAETWIDVRTAARRLELSERRVWSLVGEQRLSSVLCGGRRLISRADVEARAKQHGDTEMFQSQLQFEALYTRIEMLEKQMAILRKELSDGR